MSALGNVRGAAVDEFLAWYGRERDLDKLVGAVRSLPADLTSKLRWEAGAPRLIPFAWYPCELIHGLFDQLLRGMDGPERDRLCREVAAHVMSTTLRGVYKAMFKAVVSPGLFAKVSPRLWRLYYDTGESVVTVEADNRHRSELSGWRGHHPFLCDINRLCGEWIYAELKCVDVSSHQLACVGRGDPSCIVLTHWQ
jgi:hypothetical protein